MFEYYFEPKKDGLDHYNVEVTWGGQWVSLEDGINYAIHAESFQQVAKQHRQIKATSPVVGGDVLVHSVPEMVQETVKVIVTAQDQVELEERLWFCEELFDQFAFNMRITKNDMMETMTCQQNTTLTIEGGQIYAHNVMAIVTAAIPRNPDLLRERV